MDVDPATFLAGWYTILDEAEQSLGLTVPRHPGPALRMSDRDVLVLVLLARFQGRSERGILRWAHFSPFFRDRPLLSQSAFNRRARRLHELLAQVLTWLTIKLAVAEDAYEIVDGVPVPVAHRSRGERLHLFTPAEANVGRGGTGKGWYFGNSLVLSVAASGPITGLMLAPASTGERWSLDALLAFRADPLAVPDPIPALAARGAATKRYVGVTGEVIGYPGQTITGTYLADVGFAGHAWLGHWQDEYHATVQTATSLGADLKHWFHHARQTIETVNGTLVSALHLRDRPARTRAGLVLRVLAACVAFNLGMLINRRLGRSDFAIGTLSNL